MADSTNKSTRKPYNLSKTEQHQEYSVNISGTHMHTIAAKKAHRKPL